MVKFSVVIPTYNRANCIKRCIDSVLHQTCQDFEIVVVDNYSEDETVEIIQDYKDSRIRTFQIHNNGIIAASRNKGIWESRGEWICFLDSDDWWKGEKLQRVYDYISSNDCVFVYHKLRTFTSQGKTRHIMGKVHDGGNTYYNVLALGNPICTSSVSVKKTVLMSVGGQSESSDLIGVEDVDCWLKILHKNIRTNFLFEELGYYWVGDNLSASIKQTIQLSHLYEKHVENLPQMTRPIALCYLKYQQGTIYQNLGLHSQACLLFLGSIQKAAFSIKLKSLCKLMYSVLKCK